MGLFNILKKDDMNESTMSKEELLRLRFGTVLDYAHIKNISIILKENEYCFYKDKCVVYESKDETIGYESNYNGMNFNVAKGMRVNVGKGKSKPIKTKKEIEYKGTLYLTNKRVIFVNDTKGFEKSISDITSIQGLPPMLNLQIGNKYYNMSTPASAEFICAFYELNLMNIDKIIEPKPFPANVFDEESNYSTGKEDPLYYLVATGMIKNEGRFSVIQRKFLPIKYRRLYTILESLIENNIISEERTEEGNYKVNITYEEWLMNRIKNKEY